MSGVVLSVFLAPALLAQVIGHLDWVDQDTVLGWACRAGDAETQLAVELRAELDGKAVVIGRQLANRARDDVASSGRCGTGAGSRFHGFEFTVFPIAMMRSSPVSIQAIGIDGDQRIEIGDPRSVAFPAVGLPSRLIWRTDYDDPQRKAVALMSCIFPFKGANRIAKQADASPLFLNAGATILQANWESSPGVFSPANWCIENDPDAAEFGWSQSNAASNASHWPQQNFWVVSANTEYAYSKLNPGPPSQSHPLNQPQGIYRLRGDDDNHVILALNNDPDGGYELSNYPFLSIGAQMGRGRAGPLAWLEATGPELWVSFDVEQLSQTAGDFHDIGLIVGFHWGGYPRWVFVSLSNADARQRLHWNWNALQSFWFPGGEINYLGSRAVREECAIRSLPVLSDETVADGPRFARLPLRALLRCLQSQEIVNQHAPGSLLGWTEPMPDQPLPLTGLHLFVEQGPHQSGAHMQVRFSLPALFAKGAPFRSVPAQVLPAKSR